MMEALLARGRAIGARQVDDTIGQVQTVLADELPNDMAVTRESDGVAIEGRTLGRRMMFDVRLRAIPLLLRARLG